MADAIAMFDYAEFAQRQQAFAVELSRAPKVEVKQELEEPSDEDDPPKEKGSARGKKAAIVPNLDFLDTRLAEHPSTQFGRLVVEVVKEKFTKCGGRWGEESQVAEMVEFLRRVSEEWARTVKDPEAKEMTLALAACHGCFACLQNEATRPSVEAARIFRKTLTNMTTQPTIAGDLAKAAVTLPCGVKAMEAALDHSRAGLEDVAAMGHFTDALDKLEAIIEPHADDLLGWVLRGNSGHVHSPESFCNALVAVKKASLATMGALARLSPAGFASAQEVIECGLRNCLLVLQVASFVLANHMRVILGNSITSVMELWVDSARANAGGDQMDLVAPAMSCALSPGSAQVKVSPLMEAFGSVTSNAAAAEMESEKFCKKLRSLHEMLQKCCGALVKRAGGDFGLELSAAVQGYAGQHAQNTKLAQDLCHYLADGSELALSGLRVGAIEEGAGGDLHFRLCQFCQVHVRFVQQGFAFQLTDLFIEALDSDQVPNLAGMAGQFVRIVGEDLYDKNWRATVAERWATIRKHQIEMGIVHDSILREATVDRQLPFLIKKPTLADLLVSSLSTGGEDDMAQVSEWPHNQALNALSEFLDVVGMTEVSVADVVNEEGVPMMVPVDKVVFAGGLFCLSRNVAALATHLHHNLLVPACASKKFALEDLCGRIACELKIFQGVVAELEASVNSPAAMEVERTGMQSIAPVATVRSWTKLMGVFGGSAQTAWLTSLSHCLQSLALDCQARLPNWRASLENDKVLFAVASKMMVGQGPKVVNIHNELHSALSLISKAANMLGISPRIQDHPLTIESIRVSFDIMSKASETSIAAAAIELICRFESESTGMREAKSFLQKHNHKNHPNLPESLFMDLELIAAHAGEPKSTPPPAQTSASKPSPKPPAASSASTQSPASKRPPSDSGSGSTKQSPGAATPEGARTMAFTSSKRPRRS